jgi:hypothetical protein
MIEMAAMIAMIATIAVTDAGATPAVAPAARAETERRAALRSAPHAPAQLRFS